MNKNTSIVICCAGMGTRLGIGSTKALVKICDKPLIIHQLEQLKDFDDIRIVVGFQSEQVIDVVNTYRKDIMYVFNYDYQTAGTMSSVEKAVITAREYTVVLGGDIFVHPADLNRFVISDEECIGFSRLKSSEPIYVNVDKSGNGIAFSGSAGLVEWSGLAKIKTSSISKNHRFVYEMVSELLPMRAVEVRSIDIDTPEDYEKAVSWAKSNYSDAFLSQEVINEYCANFWSF